MSPDSDERLAYLADTVDVLWPGLDASSTPAGAHPAMTVVPNLRSPRLLVPIRPRRAAAAAALRYTAQQGVRERAMGAALALAIRAGLCERLPRVSSTLPADETIDDFLSARLGQELGSALALTHERPNRKPVLQLFNAQGRTVGFAKIGVSELAAQLVEDEVAALTLTGSRELPHVSLPQVMFHGRWKDYPVLVTSPLPLARAQRAGTGPLAEAMFEISATVPGTVEDYVAALRARGERAGATARPWRDLLEAVVAHRDLAAVRAGAWHGDWTSWNCARVGARTLVWDWERFASPAPLGFDMLHFALNESLHGRRDHFGPAAARLVEDAPALLARWRLTPRDAHTVALLYLLDVALRYMADDLRSSGPRGRVEQWAFPVVRAHLERSVRRSAAAAPSTPGSGPAASGGPLHHAPAGP